MKNGKPIGISYCTNEAKKYKEDFAKYVAEEVKHQGWEMIPNDYQHFYVDATFFFPRLDFDCNNYWKCLLDAITDTKSIWLDDNVVCERVNAILYDDKNPRIELVIHPVEYIGIFENKQAFDAFVTNCQSCRRYARNCSVLKKAREGRIQEEINNFVCEKYNKKGD